MTKRELIDEIVTINHSAGAEFLAKFDDQQLVDYLRHLAVLKTPRLTGDASRYAKHFAPRPTAASPQAGPAAPVEPAGARADGHPGTGPRKWKDAPASVVAVLPAGAQADAKQADLPFAES